MKNIYKRNKIYYIRLRVHKKLTKFFNNKSIYIRSLGVTNKSDATIIAKYLTTQFQFIKNNLMLLRTDEIKNIIEEFKATNYDDILNRNHNISIKQINEQIELLNEDLTPYSDIIQDELYDLMKLAHINYQKESLWDMDSEDINIFIDYIKKIKLKALIELKDKINNNIIVEQKEHIKSIKDIDYGITITDAIDEFLESRKHINEKTFKQSKSHIEQFRTYCEKHNLIYIKKLVNKDIVKFRTYLTEVKPNAKVSTINNTLGSIKTFLNYCLNISHYIQHNITTNILLQKSINEKLNDGVEGWTHKELKDLFTNMKLLTHNERLNVPKNYHNEYPIILLIALYTGMRQNEILQLQKEDIKFSDEHQTWYIDINVNGDKKIKNIHSVRIIPIHSELESELLKYIKNFKRKNLFTIKSKNFSKKFSDYKTKLGYPKTKKVFHSFRHTLSNELKQHLIDNVLINELTGHSQEEGAKMSANYTNKFGLNILKEQLEKISFKEYI